MKFGASEEIFQRIEQSAQCNAETLRQEEGNLDFLRQSQQICEAEAVTGEEGEFHLF
jgi:hypothetical protein